MTDSPTLFDTSWRPVENVHGLSRWNDRDTAKDAAARITGKTERQILALYQREHAYRGGWTADELCSFLPDVYPPTLKSALSRLVNHNLLVATDETRLSDRGCKQTVWALPLNASGQEK